MNSHVIGIIVALLTICYADPNMEMYAESCAIENNINLANLTDPKVKESHDFKCYLKCTATKSKFLTEEGNPNIEQIKIDYKIKDDDPLIATFKKCGEDNKADDICDKVSLVYKCIQEH